ncbi:MAG: nitroreductase family protein [Arenicella sp.]|nr:nitroreductase family protein [Arenicella sp.]
MDALTALHSRTSVNLLSEPGPTPDQLNNIFKAGLRACDHKNLRPWRYLVIEGSARQQLGQLMAKVKRTMDGDHLDPDLDAKLRDKPFRAPTIVAVIAHLVEHEKVPEIEQLYSAAASAQMMMVAAHAQNVGAIWRSGALMFHTEMQRGLGLASNEQLVGFLYMGTAKVVKPVPQLDPTDFVREWSG